MRARRRLAGSHYSQDSDGHTSARIGYISDNGAFSADYISLSIMFKRNATYFWFRLPTLAALRHLCSRDIHFGRPPHATTTCERLSLSRSPSSRPQNTASRVPGRIYNKPWADCAHVVVMHVEVHCYENAHRECNDLI